MKKQKKYRALACATMCVAVLGVAYPVYAESPPPAHHFDKGAHGASDGQPDRESKGKHHKGKMLEKLDANKDGVISKGEFLTKMEEKFAEMDKDGSGEVSAEEMAAHHKAKRAEMKKMREKMKDKSGKRPDGKVRHGEGDMPPPPPEE